MRHNLGVTLWLARTVIYGNQDNLGMKSSLIDALRLSIKQLNEEELYELKGCLAKWN